MAEYLSYYVEEYTKKKNIDHYRNKVLRRNLTTYKHINEEHSPACKERCVICSVALEQVYLGFRPSKRKFIYYSRYADYRILHFEVFPLLGNKSECMQNI